CWKELGDLRQAGMLFERRMREAPDDTASAFELGQILARFGRWDHAARALQLAADDPSLAVPAGKLLVACFDALGMSDAAQSRLDTLRRVDPSVPAKVPDMLRAAFGSERGPRSAQDDQLIAGRYRVLRSLGAGGTGRVLLAEDAFYGREVAIKVLHAGSSGAAGRDALLRFAREAKVAAGIDHPNVVRVYDYHPDGPFLVMEHMPGGTLEDRLGAPEDGPRALPPSIVRHVLRSVLSALEAVHRRGVVHRDLKPANVFFGRTGEVKLGDFGVAHLADLGATLTGAMIGTLAYMTPEQITGASRPDASTDLYALGVILYRSLSGVLPFPGPDFVAQHLELVPAPVSSVAPWLGTEFDAPIAQMLEKDPSGRPRTATEVLESIDRLPWARAELQAGLASPVAEPRHGSQPPPSRPSVVPLAADRWRPIETRADGTMLAEDELLRRTVRIVPCDDERAKVLREVALADSPFLQAVWSIDADSGRAVLEEPRGEVGHRNLAPELIAELREALSALHERGLAHGALDAAHVSLGAGRAVLLIADAPLEGSTEDDLRALASLAGPE
ncbi:MAG: serine/threonine protein kinase, partial [Myxococcota bacterium]|nr:serine/threonine protein kinase [Myxococcota bacterium]